MKRYCIKCEPGRVEFLDVLRESEDGYFVRILRNHEGYETEVESFMDHQLFDSCLSTGYIFEMVEQPSTSVA